MTTVHVVPVDDLVAHEDGVDCVCIPAVEYLIGPTGSTGKLITHHSLDGRENYEAYSSPN